jgi:hypothetical protein
MPIPEPLDTLFAIPDHMWRYRRCPVCFGSLSLVFTHTYVVQRQGWVKIGATSNPRRRVSELARPAWKQHILSPAEMDWAQPLHLVRMIDGNVEHELHQRFRQDHVRGEWFLPRKAMRHWLNGAGSHTIEIGFPR